MNAAPTSRNRSPVLLRPTDTQGPDESDKAAFQIVHGNQGLCVLQATGGDHLNLGGGLAGICDGMGLMM